MSPSELARRRRDEMHGRRPLDRATLTLLDRHYRVPRHPLRQTLPGREQATPAVEPPTPRKLGSRWASAPDFPAELEPVAAAVERSRRILALEDDWDGEGSAGYALATWERAANFVLNNSRQLWRITGRPAPAPGISPAEDGSIDVLWKHDGRMLLLNVPADGDRSASFYGEGAADDTVKGRVWTGGDNYWLLLWLIR